MSARQARRERPGIATGRAARDREHDDRATVPDRDVLRVTRAEVVADGVHDSTLPFVAGTRSDAVQADDHEIARSAQVVSEPRRPGSDGVLIRVRAGQ